MPLALIGLASSTLYSFTTPKQNRNWTTEHALLPTIQIDKESLNPSISIENIRDFQWERVNQTINHNPQYKKMQFQLENIVELKAVVSHFSPISDIAHVFLIFILDNGRELGVSIEARREKGEAFSIQGGLLAQFEIIYLLATPEDLLGIRKLNNEAIHIYPIKETKKKAQELFLLIANEINALNETPHLYHLFFKNCTNQLVKHVSTLTQQQYPWFFQTFAPGKTGEILYDLDLIDLPSMNFEEVQTNTLVRKL